MFVVLDYIVTADVHSVQSCLCSVPKRLFYFFSLLSVYIKTSSVKTSSSSLFVSTDKKNVKCRRINGGSVEPP